MPEIDTKVTDSLIKKIAERTENILKKMDKDPDVYYPRTTLVMDLYNIYYKLNLKLEDLLEAEEQEFCHDVFGIRNHLNRESDTLENCFLPRFAKIN